PLDGGYSHPAVEIIHQCPNPVLARCASNDVRGSFSGRGLSRTVTPHTATVCQPQPLVNLRYRSCAVRRASQFIKSRSSIINRRNSILKSRTRAATHLRRSADRPSIPRRNRIPPIPPKRTVADPNARRRLTALVLGPLDHVQHAHDGLALVAELGDLL